MTDLAKEILNLYSERNIQEGRGLLVQAIRTVIFERTNLREHPNIGKELADALRNLIDGGYLQASDNEPNGLILTEKGHKEIYT